MNHTKLGDQQVQTAIMHFLREARKSAQTQGDDPRGGVLGLAAMSTILACVSAVGEALIGKRETGLAIRSFYDAMTEKQQWILPPRGVTHSDAKVRELLANIRNCLAHSLSLPLDVMLLQTRQADSLQAAQYAEEHLCRWRLVVPEFIDAVEATIQTLSEERPDLDWDPERKPSERRGLVDTYLAVSDQDGPVAIVYDTMGMPTSGSSAGSAASGTGHDRRRSVGSNDKTISIRRPSGNESDT